MISDEEKRIIAYHEIGHAMVAANIDREVQQIILEQHEKARQIIRDNEEKMHELTNFLLEKETIPGEEFMQILNS